MVAARGPGEDSLSPGAVGPQGRREAGVRRREGVGPPEGPQHGPSAISAAAPPLTPPGARPRPPPRNLSVRVSGATPKLTGRGPPALGAPLTLPGPSFCWTFLRHAQLLTSHGWESPGPQPHSPPAGEPPPHPRSSRQEASPSRHRTEPLCPLWSTTTTSRPDPQRTRPSACPEPAQSGPVPCPPHPPRTPASAADGDTHFSR